MVNIQPGNLRFITMGNSSFWQRACLEQMFRLRGQFFGMPRGAASSTVIVDHGTLHHLPLTILHTSARAALAITVLKIVPGTSLATRVLSPNGHPPLLHVLVANPGDCERFDRVWILFLALS